MKRLLVSAVVAAVLSISSAAIAAPQQAGGKVKTYDAAKHELSLTGKKNTDIVYFVPATVTDPGLKPGARVTVTWDLVDGKHTVSDVKLKPKKTKPAKPAKPATN
ncbi:DUF1344 domain-containing protein [Bauldia litoralis]|uniref:DUF1344 domain-containing protein n=1 Tax=Bauldia litoralis TaxID=665467 RepID=UPI003267D681